MESIGSIFAKKIIRIASFSQDKKIPDIPDLIMWNC